MQKSKIFVIHDVAANAYLTPFFLPEIALAKRTFGDCVNDPNHAFGQHPSDYTLFQIGEFNHSSCEATIFNAPEKINNGIELYIIPTNDQPELPIEPKPQTLEKGIK